MFVLCTEFQFHSENGYLFCYGSVCDTNAMLEWKLLYFEMIWLTTSKYSIYKCYFFPVWATWRICFPLVVIWVSLFAKQPATQSEELEENALKTATIVNVMTPTCHHQSLLFVLQRVLADLIVKDKGRLKSEKFKY